MNPDPASIKALRSLLSAQLGLVCIPLALMLGAVLSACTKSSATSTLTYQFTLESSVAREQSSASAWIYIPTSWAADYSPVSEGAREVSDSLGNRQVVYSFVNVKRDFRFEQTVSIRLKSGDSEKTDLEHVSAVNDPFVNIDPLVLSKHPGLIKAAASLRGEGASQIIADLYGEVDQYISANTNAFDTDEKQLSNASPDAKTNSAETEGVTADRLTLAVMFLRAANIPARAVVGFFDDGDGVLTRQEIAIWLQYVEGGIWKDYFTVDGTGRFQPIVFRVFTNADDVNIDEPIINIYQSLGLRLRLPS